MQQTSTRRHSLRAHYIIATSASKRRQLFNFHYENPEGLERRHEQAWATHRWQRLAWRVGMHKRNGCHAFTQAGEWLARIIQQPRDSLMEQVETNAKRQREKTAAGSQPIEGVESFSH